MADLVTLERAGNLICDRYFDGHDVLFKDSRGELTSSYFAWKDASGRIWDSFYRQGATWDFQEINTQGHPAASGVFISVFDAADQQHFVYTDAAGNIWDSFYRKTDNKWDFQSIKTNGHTPVGAVFVSSFHDQQHFAWKDASGRIWDSFYRQGATWDFQEINTQGHPAASGVFVSVFIIAAPVPGFPGSTTVDQQHFTYADSAGDIWDSFYRRDTDKWDFQNINTNGHKPVGAIFVSSFRDQQHFVWRDGLGSVWDSFFAQATKNWHFQPINYSFNCMYPQGSPDRCCGCLTGSDLTPDDAPCNAINKIVRGHLEAFNATPGPNGELTELWNSKSNQNEGVWFAKQSPPTIADGKVFMVAFPPPIPGQYWSDSRAFGRLIVYGPR